MTHLKLSMIAQGYASDTRHAQTVMQDLGITYQRAIPQSLGDCWWFLGCEHVPEELPDWITELPEEFVRRFTSYYDIAL